MINKTLIIVTIFCIAIVSCNTTPAKVLNTLTLSGNNRVELENAINYFKNKQDKQQLQALYFLLENMPGKGWVEYKPFLDNGSIAPFNFYDYPDSLIVKKKKELEDSLGSSITYKLTTVHEDVKVIKANFIIENIELAFMAWRNPWAKALTFNQFCEYILPYRFSTEPLSNWRKEVQIDMNWVKDSIKNNPNNALAVCCIINDSIKKRFDFKHDELIFYPYNLTYNEALKVGGGTCDDLNLIAAYWMRSIGVPVVNDFTPVWANSNFGGHTWLSVLDSNNKNIPFNAAYDNPIVDSLPFKNDKLCKVYRRQYQKQATTFRANFPTEPQYPGFLYTDNYCDVTTEYCKTTSAEIPIKLIENYNLPFAYLGVLCQTNWKIDGFGSVKNNKIRFEDIGINTIYIAFFEREDTFQILSCPFFINDKKEVIYFNGEGKSLNELAVNIKRHYWWLRKERTYLLTFWQNNHWQNIEPDFKWNGNIWTFSKPTINFAKDSLLVYKSLPINTVYRFKNVEKIVDIGTYGRPFIISKLGYTHY